MNQETKKYLNKIAFLNGVPTGIINMLLIWFTVDKGAVFTVESIKDDLMVAIPATALIIGLIMIFTTGLDIKGGRSPILAVGKEGNKLYQIIPDNGIFAAIVVAALSTALFGGVLLVVLKLCFANITLSYTAWLVSKGIYAVFFAGFVAYLCAFNQLLVHHKKNNTVSA